MEVLKQARFGRSQSLVLWGHHIVLLALLPAYYWYMKGDVLLGLLFLCNAAAIPRQMRWFALGCHLLLSVKFIFTLKDRPHKDTSCSRLG